MLKHFSNVVGCVSPRFFVSSFQLMAVMALCGSPALISCGGGSNPPAAPTLQSISVSPPSKTVAAGLKQQYSATGSYSDGSSAAIASVTWTTSNTALATVSSSGLVTTLKQGSVTITATSGTIAGGTSLTVGPANLSSITVSPTGQTVYVDRFWQFAATGNYTDGSTQNLTNVTWSSSATNIATINSTGLAMELRPATLPSKPRPAA